MGDAIKPVPDGFHSLTPHLVVRGAAGDSVPIPTDAPAAAGG
jgi:hypothetical protein